MKKKVLFLLFFVKISFGQNALILDSISLLPIKNANVFTKSIGVSSNLDGAVDLSLFKFTDTIIITHIAYNEKKILLSSLKKNIFLSPKIRLLPTINLIQNEKILYEFSDPIHKITFSKQDSENKSITHLLRKKSPVTFQESQPGGGSLNYRGMEANRLLLIVDGLALNNTIFRGGHLQNSSVINPFFIQNVNILSGPSAVAFGNGAMGSALVFTTLENKLNTDSYNYLQQSYESSSNSVTLNFKKNYFIGSFKFISALSIKSADNLKMGNNRLHGYPEWGYNLNYINKNEQLFTDYDKLDLLNKILINLKSKTQVLLNTQYGVSSKINRFDKMNDLLDNSLKYKYWYYGPSKRFSQSVKLKKHHPTLLYENFSIEISFQNFIESRHHQKNSDSLISNRYENLKIFESSLNFKKRLKKVRFQYGIGSKSQLLSSTANLASQQNIYYNKSRYPGGGSIVNDVSLYSQIGFPVMTRTKIYLGGRYNNNNVSSSFIDTILPFSKISTQNNSYVKSFSIKHNIKNNLLLNASFYSGFRNPNIDDLGKVFSKNDNSVVVPNESLRPERAENINFSITGDLWKKIFFEFHAFNTTIFNAIQKEKTSINGDTMLLYDGEIMRVLTNMNVEKAVINGINYMMTYKPTTNFIVNSSINMTQGITSEGNPLAHIPPLNASFSVKYLNNKHLIEFYTYYNGWKLKKDYDVAGIDNLEEATNEGNPSWYTLNIYYKNNITNKLSYSFGIENLMDVHYKTFASGLSASGRNFTLSLQHKF